MSVKYRRSVMPTTVAPPSGMAGRHHHGFSRPAPYVHVDVFKLWAGDLYPGEKRVRGEEMDRLKPLMDRIRAEHLTLTGEGPGLTAAEVASVDPEALAAVRAWSGVFVYSRMDGALYPLTDEDVDVEIRLFAAG